MSTWESNQALMHYGVPNMKWGVRRYQEKDGTLTQLGKEHYGIGTGGSSKFGKKYENEIKKLHKLNENADIEIQKKAAEKHEKHAEKAAKVGAAATAVGAATILREKSEAKKLIDLGKSLWEANLYNADSRHDIDSLTKYGKIKEDDISRYWVNPDPSDRANMENWSSADMTGYHLSDLAGKIDKNFDNAQKTRMVITAAAGAAATTAFGVAAYNKIAAKVNKYRISDKGHAKAVAKRDAQYNKISNMVKDTPYMALFKEQIEAYKKEHPNTELSDKQIMKNLM